MTEPGAEATDDTEQLHAIRRRLERASNAADPSYIDEHAAEDVVVMPVDSEPAVGIDAFRRDQAAFFERYDVDEISYDSEEVVVGEEFAFDRGQVLERYKPTGAAELSEFLFNYLFLYRRAADGDWQLYRIVWKRTTPDPGE